MLILYGMGLTVNIVVLFSLIMAVGMLVDGAIVVNELADRKMNEGLSPKEAYRIASHRMAWPIISSTATTLAAFAPLLFWPGIVGEFMKYLPLTLIFTLSASLLMALIFVPVLGGIFGRPGPGNEATLRSLAAAEGGDLSEVGGLTGRYVRALRVLVKHPLKFLGSIFLLMILVQVAYSHWGKGVEFFPDVEPENAVIFVRARGNLSIEEIDAVVRQVEQRILDMEELDTIYTRSAVRLTGDGVPSDAVGMIQIEFVEWDERRPADKIFQEMRDRTDDIAGVFLEIQEPDAGPPTGKPVQLEFSSRFPERIAPELIRVRQRLEEIPGVIDVLDSRPEDGFEWEIIPNREEAARYGLSVSSLGSAIQMVSNGILVGDYRPNDSDEEVEIRVRFPDNYRNLEQMSDLMITSPVGLVPMGLMVEQRPGPKVTDLDRVDGRRVMTLSAGLEPGLLTADVVEQMRVWLEENPPDPMVELRFRGEDEEQAEAQAFLGKAFVVAIFIMGLILVTQFNSIFQAMLILTAVVFSTIGVFLGLLVTHQPFGVVMNGIGVIALAGIVVNNNIVLIDTFNFQREQSNDVIQAVLRTGAQRLRPVLLTTVTTILGLLPMVFGVNIDFFNRDINVGSPSTQWWTQLSTSIVFGLAFSTFLTLGLTPALLVLGERMNKWLKNLSKKKHAVRTGSS